MVTGQKQIGGVAPTPGITSEIEGAPSSLPGGNDGKDKAEMQGAPVTSASVPPSVASELADTSKAAQEVEAVTGTVENGEGTDDNGGETKPVPTTDTDSAGQSDDERLRRDAVAGSDRKIAAYRAFIDSLPELESPEKRAKRERMEKSKRIIAAMSDGLSAMSNLYFTSQYAPNMYNHEKDSMGIAVDRHLQRLKAEKDKNREAHLRFALGLGDAENERAKTLRELEAQREAQKIARQKAQQEAELHPLVMAIKGEQKNKAQADALSSQYEAMNKPTELKLKNDTEAAKRGSYEASAANSYASAGAHNRSNVAEFPAWDEHGREYKFQSQKAAENFAKQHGTWKEEDNIETSSTETRRTPEAKPKTATVTKTKKVGYPAKPQSPVSNKGKGYGSKTGKGKGY